MGSFTSYVMPLGGRKDTLICYAIASIIWRAVVRSVTTMGGIKNGKFSITLRVNDPYPRDASEHVSYRD